MPQPNKGEHQKDFITRCIKELLNEGKEQDQSYAICISKWENKMDSQEPITNIGFDYDGTLDSKKDYKIRAYAYNISNGDRVYIITKRNETDNNEDLYTTAITLKIPKENIIFTNGADKSTFIKKYNIQRFYDNESQNCDEIITNTTCECIVVK